MPRNMPTNHKEVSKVWGSETWIINTQKYCGKLLSLKKGWRCSLHYHKIKDECFYINKGKVLMEWCQVGEKINKKVMIKGDSLHLLPLTVHRFTGIEDAEIFEFSTQHFESDSYRFTSSGKV